MSGWENVTRRRPCAICGRADWCRFTTDDELEDCYRLGDANSVEHQDINGATFWRYRSGSSIPTSKRPEAPLPPSAERASIRDLDMVYRELLHSLYLGTGHLDALRKRGLANADIERFGYRSLPLSGRYRIVQYLIRQFGQEVISKVPGFIQRRGESGAFWTLAGSPGLVIPVRNVDGTITGLNIRCDEPGDGGRYRWLSSKRHGGPGPEMIAHVPLHHGDTSIVRVTEGPLKADVATRLSGVLSIGLPGVASWKLCLPVLEQIRPTTILLAFDGDWRSNPHVATALGECSKHLHKTGFNCKVEVWEPGEGKGIDDVLAAGYSPQLKPWVHAIVCKRRGTARKIKRVVMNGL